MFLACPMTIGSARFTLTLAMCSEEYKPTTSKRPSLKLWRKYHNVIQIEIEISVNITDVTEEITTVYFG